MKKVLKWVIPALSGENEKLSIRRLLALMIGLVYNFSVVYLVVCSNSAMYNFLAVAVSAVVFLLLIQVIYPSHLIDALKAYNPKKEHESN